MTEVIAGLIGAVVVIAAVLVVVMSAAFVFIDAASVIWTAFDD